MTEEGPSEKSPSWGDSGSESESDSEYVDITQGIDPKIESEEVAIAVAKAITKDYVRNPRFPLPTPLIYGVSSFCVSNRKCADLVDATLDMLIATPWQGGCNKVLIRPVEAVVISMLSADHGRHTLEKCRRLCTLALENWKYELSDAFLRHLELVESKLKR